jgi:hypothetical protein
MRERGLATRYRAPTFTIRARERSDSHAQVYETGISDFLPIDIAAVAAIGVELAQPPFRLGLEVRGSLGLIDRNLSEESPKNLHTYGLFVLGTVLYWP